MTHRVFCVVIAIMMSVLNAGAQNQTNIWYFGMGAGVDFNSGTASGLNNGQTAIPECSGSACDVNGNLLFYTDGLSVWDKNHNLMPNGTGLAGGADATQLLIVPEPGNCSRYYIFHVQDHIAPSTNNLSYSIVDMCLNGGNGDVVSTSKNVFLNSPCGEKITAANHANGTDVWIISHKLGNNQFIAYQLSPSGITGPVSTYLGASHALNHMIGPIKASHDGSKICIANTFGWLCELYDFDNATGVLSNFVNLYNVTSVTGRVYGIEFSPNDNFLYIATTFNNNDLFQVDLSNYATTNIYATGQTGYVIGALQSAPDGKIYLARNNQNSLGVINAPNLAGVASSFVAPGLTLPSPALCRMGMPNYLPSLIQHPSPFFVDFLGNDTTVSSCAGGTLLLQTPDVCNSTFLWSDGSTADSLVVSTPGGNITVQVNNICGNYSDTIHVMFSTSQNSIGISSSSSSICAGDSVVLIASGNMAINWQSPVPASQQQNNSVWVSPQTTTVYSVIGTDSCGTDTASFSVVVNQPPQASFSYNVSCSDTVQFSAQSSSAGAMYYWSFGDSAMATGSNPFHIYGDSGLYFVNLIAVAGNCADTANQWVQVQNGIPFSAGLLPNTFTPNGDGINESYRLYNAFCEPVKTIIFDRWGIKMFESEDISLSGWDGNAGGQPVPEGTYFVIFTSGEKTLYRGSIQIFR